MMGFFTEVQMRCECVFEHMHDQVTHQYQSRRRRRERQALRYHLQKHRPQHEPGTQRDEVPQGPPRPFVGSDDDAANHIRPGRGQGEKKGFEEGSHEGISDFGFRILDLGEYRCLQVLPIRVKMATSWLHSWNRRARFPASPIPASSKSSIQYSDSAASFSTIAILCTKS